MFMNFMAHKKPRSLMKDAPKNNGFNSPFNNFYYGEVAKLTGAGGWSVNFRDKKSFLDPEARRILNTPVGYTPSLKTALEFYAPEHKARAAEVFMACSMGTEFHDETVKMLTYEGKEFWVRASGRPVYDENNKIIGIQGVFQDIHSEKLKEESLEKSIKVIQSQNSRLVNFAHIVSHNLRSHASNLQLTLELMNAIDSPAEEEELMKGLSDISDSLSDTINHLNEIVSAQSKSQDERRVITFEEVLHTVKNSINRIIIDTDTEIFSDFSEAPRINYIPSYLESILLNLVTNAIKYKHPDRDPVIDIFTREENGETFLIVKDNGRGIDMDTYGDKLFNMYETFHQNSDAIGIGLFITKNQVETLQGTINASSEVDHGTVFTIKF